MPQETEILRQLSEIQRGLGQNTATVEGLREDLKTLQVTGDRHRGKTYDLVNNMRIRIQTVEEEIANIQTTLKKTILPMADDAFKKKQRMIGFIAAGSLIASLLGGLFGIFLASFDQIIKLFR